MRRITAAWLRDEALQSVLRALSGHGHQAYIVGGCVRNALLGVAVADVDIATDARPDRVIEIARNAGLKAVPTGIDHGTVTLVAQGTGFEVTTFRADTETDGRHAIVRFSDSLAEDARRRDFTMNALYADAAGEIIDPLGGLPDLRARRVRFIENPLQRIREDYLRILRFFRFTAWYGDPDPGFDAEALAAIAASLDGLDGLSRERVTGELLKLLAAPDPAPAIATMARIGVLARILPGSTPEALPLLIHAEGIAGALPDPLRRLAVLGAVDVAHLRLSRADQKRLALLHDGVEAGIGAGALGYRHGLDAAGDILLLRSALFEQPLEMRQFDAAARGAAQVFPLGARDLMPRYEGPKLGAALAALETAWIESDFTLDRDALLRRI